MTTPPDVDTRSIPELLRDAALERDARRHARWRSAERLLRLGDRDRMVGLADIEPDTDDPATFVAEVAPRFPVEDCSLWFAVVDGDRLNEAFESVDFALLGLVAARFNGRNENDKGWVFAARALGVKAAREALEVQP